ncbi:SAM-dependent methyltransferase [Roseomonas sp. 18066]|uniref:SAM-dependent methyltransferase n=1 Tax=Roseomonas sp. 18066 TaxID=2681412 RepID=UPI00135A3EDE|nr:SAM-dependent methyltransferase [Roseomonas sp. 18066]
MIRSAYLTHEGFHPEVEEELRRKGVAISRWHGPLALSEQPPVDCAWALDVWTDPREIAVPSIKGAASALRAIQRNWSLEPVLHHRRAALIAGNLPPLKPKALSFPEVPPAGHLGGWTLLAPDLMLASPTKTSPFVNGAIRFAEDREGPPSRAYLKLWEALTRIGRWPGPGETSLDLGAAPGGWTWALAQLGGQVIAVDKAQMDPAVAALPNVAIRTESAFGMAPEQQPVVDWLFSDIICYPARLLGLVERWMAAGRARNYVCTLKFQGETDHDTAEKFAAIPGAKVFHGAHNKHELMFCLLDAPVRD